MDDELEKRRLDFLCQLQDKINSIKNSNVYKMDLEAIKLFEKTIFEIQLLTQENKSLRKKLTLIKFLKDF